MARGDTQMSRYVFLAMLHSGVVVHLKIDLIELITLEVKAATALPFDFFSPFYQLLKHLNDFLECLFA